jgi:hypothetical protein
MREKLDELARLHAAATMDCDGLPGEWNKLFTFYKAAYNAFPDILEYVRRLESELQGWRHEREMTLTAFAHVRDGGNPALIGHPNGSVFGNALREMLAQQRREGAAEWLEKAAREGGYYERSSEGMLEEAKQLREVKV